MRLVVLSLSLIPTAYLAGCGNESFSAEATAAAACECGFDAEPCEAFIVGELTDSEATSECLSARRAFYECFGSNCTDECLEEQHEVWGMCDVGDSCTPDLVPVGGFLANETFLETGSVQCETRVCLVRELGRDPNDICGQPDATQDCVTANEVAERVYCSCRCSVPEGSLVPICPCPSGFKCEDILRTGGASLEGGYCIRSDQ